MSQLKELKHVSTGLDLLVAGVAAKARAAGVFGEVTTGGGRLAATALSAAAPAEYRIDADAGRVWVSLVTADRWLSQSIEADLVHTGDDLRGLIDEELVDQGETRPSDPFQHYRSEDKLFTFRTPLPLAPGDLGSDAAIDLATRYLLAYEACFRRLGDIDAGEDE